MPGLLREKCIALIKTLAKPIRRQLAPAAEAVASVYEQLDQYEQPLTQALAKALFSIRGVKVSSDDFAIEKLDPYYLLNYRLIDVDGSFIEQGRDLDKLKQSYSQAVKQSIKTADVPERKLFEKSGMSAWNCQDLPIEFNYRHDGMTVTAYPALKYNSADNCFDLRLFENRNLADYHHHNALVELALKQVETSQSYKYLLKSLLPTPKKNKPGLANLATQLERFTADEHERNHWVIEIMQAALTEICFPQGTQNIRGKTEFEEAIKTLQGTWVERALAWEESWLNALRQNRALLKQLNAIQASSVKEDQTLENTKSQLYRLFKPNRLRELSFMQLKQYPRYLKAISVRLDHRRHDFELEKRQNHFDMLYQHLNSTIENKSTPKRIEQSFAYINYPKLQEYEFMLEEWRVSLFAQQLKTRIPISIKRLDKFLQDAKLDRLIEHK